jgi:hypothetical protein
LLAGFWDSLSNYLSHRALNKRFNPTNKDEESNKDIDSLTINIEQTRMIPIPLATADSQTGNIYPIDFRPPFVPTRNI